MVYTVTNINFSHFPSVYVKMDADQENPVEMSHPEEEAIVSGEEDVNAAYDLLIENQKRRAERFGTELVIPSPEVLEKGGIQTGIDLEKWKQSRSPQSAQEGSEETNMDADDNTASGEKAFRKVNEFSLKDSMIDADAMRARASRFGFNISRSYSIAQAAHKALGSSIALAGFPLSAAATKRIRAKLLRKRQSRQRGHNATYKRTDQPAQPTEDVPIRTADESNGTQNEIPLEIDASIEVEGETAEDATESMVETQIDDADEPLEDHSESMDVGEEVVDEISQKAEEYQGEDPLRRLDTIHIRCGNQLKVTNSDMFCYFYPIRPLSILRLDKECANVVFASKEDAKKAINLYSEEIPQVSGVPHVHDSWRVSTKPIVRQVHDGRDPAGSKTVLYMRYATIFDTKENFSRNKSVLPSGPGARAVKNVGNNLIVTKSITVTKRGRDQFENRNRSSSNYSRVNPTPSHKRARDDSHRDRGFQKKGQVDLARSNNPNLNLIKYDDI